MELGEEDAARDALRTGLRLDVTNLELSRLTKELKARAAAASASAKRRAQAAKVTAPGAVQAQISEATKEGEYVGTLRWDDSTKFKELCALPTPLWSLPTDIPKGWEQFMNARMRPNADGDLVVEPTMLDGLSYPMSLVWAVRHLELRPATAANLRKPLTVVAIGAASRSEERLLHKTNYWAELGTWLPASQIDLWLVGPEVTAKAAAAEPKPLPVPAKGGAPVVARCFSGTLREFMAAEPALFARECRATAGEPPKTIIVGFNTGAGSGVAKLMQSWCAAKPTTRFLCELTPCCAAGRWTWSPSCAPACPRCLPVPTTTPTLLWVPFQPLPLSAIAH